MSRVRDALGSSWYKPLRADSRLRRRRSPALPAEPREGDRQIPELELAGQADNGRTALEKIRALQPDVAVIEVEMPQIDGLCVLRAVVRDQALVRILLLSGYFDSDLAYRAVRDGAAGFLSKDEDERAICEAIAAVARGETVLGPHIQAAIAQRLRDGAEKPAAPLLTSREIEVLRLTASGMSSVEIGSQLHLSPATVKTNLQRIYAKIGVSDRAAAVAEGMRLGLLE